jgi:hypothetical protein
MIPEDIRQNLERWVTAYRHANEVWPLFAFELSMFAHAQGGSIDWSGFHQLHFLVENGSRLRLSYVLAPDDQGWSESGEARVIAREENGSLHWNAVWMWGTRRRVQVVSFCERATPYQTAV